MTRDLVFVSYRRDDAGAQAGHLAEVLKRHLGEGQIFFDTESVQGGQRFPDRIQEALERARVLLVVMGSGWLTTPDEHGRRRIDDPDDWVHREVQGGLSQGVEVIPVLVDDARMPLPKAFPEPLAALAERRLMRLEHAQFAQQSKQIAQRIEALFLEGGIEIRGGQAVSRRRSGPGYEPYSPQQVEELERLSLVRDQGTPLERTQRQRRITELATELARSAGPEDVVVGSRLVSRIGKGNYGTVWQACDVETGEARAVKIFDTDRLGLGTSLYHFRRGVRAMQHLGKVDGHPRSVVRLQAAEASCLAFSMEYLDGGDLTHVAEHGWSLKKKLELMLSVCGAVAFAHQSGIIHRDIKPANIVLRGGEPVLTDFDIADLLFAKTRSAQASGTVKYSAPEALDGKGVSAPTVDVFSLGRLLYFLLLECDPPLMFEERPKLDDLAAADPGLAAIIRKCTLWDPRERYSTVASLMADLEPHWESGGQATTPPKVDKAVRIPAARPPRGPRPGVTVERYQLLAPVGERPTGSIWAAQQVGAPMRRLVAVKIGLSAQRQTLESQRALIDEAWITSLIHHPQVCEVYELGQHGAAVFLAMEWCDGASLRRVMDRLDNGRLEPGVAARIVANVAAGLHAAHEVEDSDGTKLHVVHRDVSPQNILISKSGHVKLVDFGAAKAEGRLHHPTEADDEMKGRLCYMAPEQVRGTVVDRRADIFALGCVLYEVTVGRRSFEGDGAPSTLYQLLELPAAPPSETVEGYPLALSAIVLKALAKDPAKRYQTAEDLRVALEMWLANRTAPVSDRAIAELLRKTLGDELDEQAKRINEAAARLFPKTKNQARSNSQPTHSTSSVSRGRAAAMVEERSVATGNVRGRSSWWLPVGAALTVLGVVVVLARGGWGSGEMWGAPHAVAPQPTLPSEVTSHLTTTQPREPAQPVAAPEPQQVEIAVRTIPTRANIRIDGGDLLSAPYSMKVTPSQVLHELTASAPNYESVTLQVSFDQTREIVIELERQ